MCCRQDDVTVTHCILKEFIEVFPFRFSRRFHAAFCAENNASVDTESTFVLLLQKSVSEMHILCRTAIHIVSPRVHEMQ